MHKSCHRIKTKTSKQAGGLTVRGVANVQGMNLLHEYKVSCETGCMNRLWKTVSVKRGTRFDGFRALK
jgi:hypothetical protein